MYLKESVLIKFIKDGFTCLLPSSVNLPTRSDQRGGLRPDLSPTWGSSLCQEVGFYRLKRD